MRSVAGDFVARVPQYRDHASPLAQIAGLTVAEARTWAAFLGGDRWPLVGIHDGGRPYESHHCSYRGWRVMVSGIDLPRTDEASNLGRTDEANDRPHATVAS